MQNYDLILFDADETLFRFDAFQGLQRMLARYGVALTQQDYLEYQTLNKPLWVEYQNGAITIQQLQQRRFQVWATQLQVAPQELNSAFMTAMAEICTPLEGAANLIHALHGRTKLGIITNGSTELQQIRLQRTGLLDRFEAVVISEEVGIAKPDKRIFDHALALLGNPARERVLMVGDTLESDILGGLNAGLQTCWFNAENKPSPTGIAPHHQVASLGELEGLLLGELTPIGVL